MSGDIKVRLATPVDVEAIFDIRTSVRENHISRERMAEMGITPASIKEMILGAPCTWLGEVDGIPAAFSMGDVETGSVFALFVRPDFEGRGLGRRLLAEVETLLFRHHPVIWLETGSDTRAAGFYRTLGWHATQRLEDGQTRFEKQRE